mgnify:CR=1 FL=1
MLFHGCCNLLKTIRKQIRGNIAIETKETSRCKLSLVAVCRKRTSPRRAMPHSLKRKKWSSDRSFVARTPRFKSFHFCYFYSIVQSFASPTAKLPPNLLLPFVPKYKCPHLCTFIVSRLKGEQLLNAAQTQRR